MCACICVCVYIAIHHLHVRATILEMCMFWRCVCFGNVYATHRATFGQIYFVSTGYGVDTISRLLQIMSPFCRKSSLS